MVLGLLGFYILGVYILGVHSLGPRVLDLAPHSRERHSGGLFSRAIGCLRAGGLGDLGPPGLDREVYIFVRKKQLYRSHISLRVVQREFTHIGKRCAMTLAKPFRSSVSFAQLVSIWCFRLCVASRRYIYIYMYIHMHAYTHAHIYIYT